MINDKSNIIIQTWEEFGIQVDYARIRPFSYHPCHVSFYHPSTPFHHALSFSVASSPQNKITNFARVINNQAWRYLGNIGKCYKEYFVFFKAFLAIILHEEESLATDFPRGNGNQLCIDLLIPYTQKVFISTNFHHFRQLSQLILKVANFTIFILCYDGGKPKYLK